MKNVGNNQQWIDFFSDGFISNILELIFQSWITFTHPCQNELENEINLRFLQQLRNQKRKRPQDLPFFIDPEINIFSKSSGELTGRIDFRFLPAMNQLADENIYFGVECKKLRITDGRNLRSNTSNYIGDEGLMRFITGRYCSGHQYGAMVGYVMDGESDKAILSISEAMQLNREKLHLRLETCLEQCPALSRRRGVRQSFHEPQQGEISIFHLFLDVRA